VGQSQYTLGDSEQLSVTYVYHKKYRRMQDVKNMFFNFIKSHNVANYKTSAVAIIVLNVGLVPILQSGGATPRVA
jgi:hypothetical protein